MPLAAEQILPLAGAAAAGSLALAALHQAGPTAPPGLARTVRQAVSCDGRGPRGDREPLRPVGLFASRPPRFVAPRSEIGAKHLAPPAESVPAVRAMGQRMPIAGAPWQAAGGELLAVGARAVGVTPPAAVGWAGPAGATLALRRSSTPSVVQAAPGVGLALVAWRLPVAEVAQ